MAVIVGLDVGIHGAAASFCPADVDGPEFISDAIDLPLMPDGSKSQIDELALADWLRTVRATHAFVENVRAMPSVSSEGSVRRSMGAAGAFRFGLAAGQIRTTLRMMGITPEFVEPSSWKRHFRLSGPDKEQSRQLALELWPLSAYLLRRKRDHNRAEAMLLAKYGARPAIGRGI